MDANRSVVLSGHNVTKRFGGLAAVNNLDFEVYANEILGIIGPNGAGKTTLFNLIAGVYKPNAGMISLRGESISGLRADQICKKGIARTFQIAKPFLHMTVLENVLVGTLFGSQSRKNMQTSQGYAEELLTNVGLASKRDYLASELTLGDRKRLEVARALSTGPSILLLDEVVAGLSHTEILEILQVIKRIREEKRVTILMIEHVMKAVMGTSDRILVLHYGEKIAEGPPRDVAKNQDVIEAYLGGKSNAHPA